MAPVVRIKTNFTEAILHISLYLISHLASLIDHMIENQGNNQENNWSIVYLTDEI